MSNIIIPLTVWKDGADFNTDLADYDLKTKYVQAATIRKIEPAGTGSIIAVEETGLLQEFRCLETPVMVKAAENPASTNYFATTEIASAVSAAGTVQGDATALTKYFNNVSTVGSGAGVRLPSATKGKVIFVVNTGANALKVYPATGHTINAEAANAAITLAVGAGVRLACKVAGAWKSVDA